MKRTLRFLPWFYGFVLATLLFLFLNHVSYFRYENSDDILIVKAFMGFEGGVPATFQLYQHTLLSYLLGWLSRAIPGVAWFSLMQLGFLWLSVAMIAKGLCDIFSSKLSLLIRLCLSGIFTTVFAAFAFARINFTTTAAMLGAAAVAALASAIKKENIPLFSIILSILLLLCSYMLRAQSCLASFPFWMVALVYLFLTHRTDVYQLRRLGGVLLAALIVFVGLYTIRAYELRDPELQELIHFQDANAGPMDYAEDRLMTVSDEVLEEIGWTRAELALVQEWYFMDENITPEAFEKLDAALATAESLPAQLSRTFSTLASFYKGNQRYVLGALILLLLSAVCFLSYKKAGCPLLPLAAACTLLLTIALLFYLALQGRFLARAADCALFPAGALLCSLAANAFERSDGSRRAAALVLMLLCLGCTALHGFETLDILSDRPDQVSATRESDLESYALAHPDKLILRTPNLLRDTRLLPDVSAGMPANIMIWGDWYCRTPSWYYQLEAFGFDGRHFTAADFLDEALLFVTEQEAPPEALMTYLNEFTGQAVAAELIDTRGELRFFCFD